MSTQLDVKLAVAANLALLALPLVFVAIRVVVFR